MISVITPAHNEEGYIAACLESVLIAAAHVDEPVEHVVVLNRCTDRTETIAESRGARTVVEDARNLSRIRNAGAAAALGETLVTIDADSRMSPNMLTEVCQMLGTTRYVGGGVRIYPERYSLGVCCSAAVVLAFTVWRRVSGGMFWCRKADFDAIGGFDERLISVEDVDFAQRLKRHGRTTGRKYGTIRRAHIVTSCRKLDQFGDWYFVRKPWVVYQIFRGDPEIVNEFYYDARE